MNIDKIINYSKTVNYRNTTSLYSLLRTAIIQKQDLGSSNI